MEKITRDVAEAEVTKWLDKKKITASTRERNEDYIETIVDYVMDGTLILEDDFKWTHNLLFPIESDSKATIESISYKPRLTDNDTRPKMAGVKAGDADGRLTGYICALTGQARGVISALDSQDKKIAMAIAIFFL